MAVRRSRVVGVNRLRRKLRRMDPEITKALRGVVEDGLRDITADAKMFVPVDEGDLRRSIVYELSRDGLTGVSGPGVKGARINRSKTGSEFGRTLRGGKNKGQKVNLSNRSKQELWQFYKGYWIEFGTKGSPKNNVPAQPARPFMGPAYKSNEHGIAIMVRNEVNKAIEKAAGG